MTAMPELVAILHSFVGAAAVLVGIGTHLAKIPGQATEPVHDAEIFLGVLVGAVTFTGSIIAFLKLRGTLGSKPLLLPGRHVLNLVLVGSSAVLGGFFVTRGGAISPDVAIFVMTGIAAVLGMHLVLAIGGGDMPVVVSLLNSYSGWAASAAGFMLENDLLIITGALVGSSGAILSYVMCKAMNRSIWSVVFGGFGADSGAKPAAGGTVIEGKVTEATVQQVADLLLAARRVIVVPGYGMAVAQAQHPVREITSLLEARGVKVHYAIHPVAGRLPGHMNVLLAEGRRLLRDREGDGGDQRGLRDDRRGRRHRRERHREPERPRRRVEPHLRHAGARSVEGGARRDAEARHGGGLRRGRQPALLQGEHDDALRRREAERHEAPRGAPGRHDPRRRLSRLDAPRALADATRVKLYALPAGLLSAGLLLVTLGPVAGCADEHAAAPAPAADDAETDDLKGLATNVVPGTFAMVTGGAGQTLPSIGCRHYMGLKIAGKGGASTTFEAKLDAADPAFEDPDGSCGGEELGAPTGLKYPLKQLSKDGCGGRVFESTVPWSDSGRLTRTLRIHDNRASTCAKGHAKIELEEFRTLDGDRNLVETYYSVD